VLGPSPRVTCPITALACNTLDVQCLYRNYVHLVSNVSKTKTKGVRKRHDTAYQTPTEASVSPRALSSHRSHFVHGLPPIESAHAVAARGGECTRCAARANAHRSSPVDEAPDEGMQHIEDTANVLAPMLGKVGVVHEKAERRRWSEGGWRR